MIFSSCFARVIIPTCVLFAACKTTSQGSAVKAEDKSGEISVATLAEKLRPEQKKIIADFLIGLESHVRKFHQRPELTLNLQGQLKACGNLNQPSLLSVFSGHYGYLQPCGTSQLKADSELMTIAEVSKLKRSASLDKSIEQFNELVVPTIIDALMESYDARPKTGDAQVGKVLDLVNQVAVFSKLVVAGVEWRPDYVSSLRYLNQVVLSELSKEHEEDIDWRLVKAAATARLDIFPLSPGDAGINPIIVPLRDPLYKLLYGPSARGAAYWIMQAASTVRLHSYEVDPAWYDLEPEEVTLLSNIPKQILLESPEDQKTIIRAIKYLTRNFQKVI